MHLWWYFDVSSQVQTMHTVSLTHSVSQPSTLHLKTSSPTWISSSETSMPHMQAWRLIVQVLCTCCIWELSSRIGSVCRISSGLGYAGMGSWGSSGVIALSGSVLSQTVVLSRRCNLVSTIRFLVAGSTTATKVLNHSRYWGFCGQLCQHECLDRTQDIQVCSLL